MPGFPGKSQLYFGGFWSGLELLYVVGPIRCHSTASPPAAHLETHRLDS